MKLSAAIFLSIVLFSCQSVEAQSKKVRDTAMQAPRVANDSTALLTYKDFQELNTFLQDFPAKYANPITQWLQARYQQRAQEYMRKP
jgi:hypothetical protein